MTRGPGWRRLGLLAVLGTLSAFGPLSMDLYLPATPTIGVDLRASQVLVQLTLSGCVAGLAAGQLVAGPLSDSLGRRRPLLAGVAAFTLISLACAFAPDIAVLVALRFLQGMAGAAGIVISVAVVRDLYGARDTARILASLTLVSGLAPVLAPVVGGQLLRVTSWRGVFVALAGVGLVLLIASWRVPETVPPERRTPLGLGRMRAASAALWRDRAFSANAAAVALSTAALLTYISAAPFIVEDSYRLSPQWFSAIFSANALGLAAAAQLSARLARRRSPAALLRASLAAQAAGAAALVAAASLGRPPLAALLIPLFVVVAAFGMVRPNGVALALAGHAGVAGTASAYLGASQFLAGAVLAPLAGVDGTGSAGPAAVLIGVLSLAALVVQLALTRRWRPPARGPAALTADEVAD